MQKQIKAWAVAIEVEAISSKPTHTPLLPLLLVPKVLHGMSSLGLWVKWFLSHYPRPYGGMFMQDYFSEKEYEIIYQDITA